MPTPYTLNMTRALKRLRTAFEAGQLSAQNEGHCQYVDPERGPCAIGAMLPKAVLKRIVSTGMNTGTSVGFLFGDEGVLAPMGLEDRTWLEMLQGDHDNWVEFFQRGYGDDQGEANARAQFAQTLADAETHYCVTVQS